MPPVASRQIEVYPFRRRLSRVEILLVRRSAERTLPGVWQPVTGGIERGETAWRAAAREVLEETGLTPLRWWALEHMTVYYEPAKDAVLALPLFAAEVAATDPVPLSHEHDRSAFLAPAAAARRVIWESQRRALEALRDEVLRPGARPGLREITDRVAGLRLERRAAARGRARRG